MRQTRKVVTALFCDVTGSTALGEELDPEVLRGVINRYFEELRAVIERHGGTVEKFAGDAVMAVFGIPQVHEDDALRAVRAAAEIRDRMPAIADEVGVELKFRTGVNTGHVLMGEGENLAIGDAVNIAARLEQIAQPGEIVLGEETRRLVRDAVEVEAFEPLELKGKSQPVAAFRLVRLDPAAPAFARQLDVPLVGRVRELALMRQTWGRVVQESGCHLFTLLGEAGVGKSRLAAELLSMVDDVAIVLRGRCLHYGEGITFWPLVEALAALGEPARPVLHRMSSGNAATPEELFWEVRRLLEALATDRPVIVHVDDLQWAEPMLLDLLDHVIDLSRGAPILLLCTARPELLENRIGWGGGKLNATTLLLQPLAPVESEALLDQLGDRLDPDARARVIAASDGNPLFLEEMVALSRERGTVEVPPTIQALLAARLERLDTTERELLERGAVEGEVFHRLAVQALAGAPLSAEVDLRLAGLVRKELIRPHPSTLTEDDAFRFRHLLIRDAAYDALPKAVRAELHERFTRWLEESGPALPELNEIAGWHLEQAVRYQRELGRKVDPALTHGAARHLYSAGQQAGRRSDMSAASSLLERALKLAPADEKLHVRIAVELAEQLLEGGDAARVDELLAIAEGDSEVGTAAALVRLQWLIHAKPQGAANAFRTRLPGLLERLATAGDELGLAKAHMVAAHRYGLASCASEMARELRLAAVHAHEGGDEGLRCRALAWSVWALVFGPSDPTEMTAGFDEIEREGQGAFVQAWVELGRGEVERLRGDFGEARRWARCATETFAALGNAMEFRGWRLIADTARLQGDLAAALAALQHADAIVAEAGQDTFRSTLQATIAEVNEQLGDREAALAAIQLCVTLSASEDVINYVITDTVRARLALAEGDAVEAELCARRAIQRASQTDFPIYQAAAHLQLARVLSALGRTREAAEQARYALELSQLKGDQPRISEARGVLDRL